MGSKGEIIRCGNTRSARFAIRFSLSISFSLSFSNIVWIAFQQNRYKPVVSVPAQQDPWGAPILPSMAAHCQALGGRSEQNSMGNSLLAESYPPPRAIPSLGCVKDIAKKQTLGLCLEKSSKLAQAITRCLAKEAKDRKH